MRDAKQIASELEFPIILDGGHLLGAYKNGQAMPYDEDDADFAVPGWVANHKMLNILRAFESQGFTLRKLRDTLMSFERYKSRVDFLFYKVLRPGLYYMTLYAHGRQFAMKVPTHYWDELATIDLMGEVFVCPKDIDTYVDHRFGDWREPTFRPEFTYLDYLKDENLTEWLP